MPHECWKDWAMVTDNSTVSTLQETPDTVEDGSASAVGAELEFRRSGVTVPCQPGSTVLEAALGAGVALRSSCRQGLCGTCKLTLIEGQVDMRHQGGIRQREIDRGFFLPCCSRPVTDLVIDA
ncbi:MAG TPA: 2Fe-2S iron-sulfur cluster binding domain-containing protein [Propionibacterium sp.]|jgi:ferredoxin|nr:2Fe-2S iron-sulfur cluster binding domain-containing protein [Propionibacterium sp.]